MAEASRAMTDTPPPDERSRARRALDWAVEEFKQLAVVFLYLYVCYAIFNLHERMVLEEHRIDINILGLAVINALVLAKVMIVAEHLNIARRFHDHPLVVPIALKSLAFAVLFLVFHVLEGIVIGVAGGRGVLESVPAVGGGGIAGFTSAAVIMTVVLVPYFAYREIGRVIGAHVLHAALFRRRPPA
jgi:hypothetical protein